MQGANSNFDLAEETRTLWRTFAGVVFMNKDRPEGRSGVEGSEPGAVKVGAAADTAAADAAVVGTAVVGTAVVGTAARSIEAETRWADWMLSVTSRSSAVKPATAIVMR